MKVNEAIIVESEVFVYNLGTMFYIDKVLFVKKEFLPSTSTMPVQNVTTQPSISTSDIENVPEEIAEESGSQPDVLFADAEATTGNEPKVTVSQNVTIK